MTTLGDAFAYDRGTQPIKAAMQSGERSEPGFHLAQSIARRAVPSIVID